MQNLLSSNAALYRDGTYAIYTNRCGQSKHLKKAREVLNSRPRKYRIDVKKVRSATLALWESKRGRHLLFVTVTCPHAVSDKLAAKAWRLFLKNVAINRKLRRYVWVKEPQEKNKNRIHYHIIFDLNYINVKYLQRAWETSFKSATHLDHRYHNSVRLGRRPIVNSIDQVSRYLSKYVAKRNRPARCSDPGINRVAYEYDGKAYGFSEGLNFKTTIEGVEVHILMQKFASRVFIDEPYLFAGRFDDQVLQEIQKLFLPRPEIPSEPVGLRIKLPARLQLSIFGN